MTDLAEECIGFLNEGHFQVVDAGPLHVPIHGFSLRRDDKLALILETDADPEAKSTAVDYPPGTVRLNTERVKLVNIAGVEAELVGVVPFALTTSHGDPVRKLLKERAQVHLAQVTPGDLGAATYTIDWLENLPASPFIWPDIFKTVMATATTRSIGLANEGITISGSDERISTGRAAARLTIAGVTLYVCALGRKGAAGGIKPGCIVYVGTPDDLFRKKVRTALSFAFGLYLVDLGCTFYDRHWHIVSAVARNAYSLGQRAFEMGPDQLAPLGPRYLYELGRNELTRMVGALVAAYDELDLGNLSWAYWHACTATVHIAPAHFGAAIEGLQRAYIDAHPGAVSKTILPHEPWQRLKAAMAASIAEADILDESKRMLTGKLFNLNQSDQRPLLKAVLDAIGLHLGLDEDSAWRRRNKAAHGMPIPEGEELAAIRDMKLLKGLFHRMLLRIANAADLYIDHVSPNHPYRRLEEPPSYST